MNNSHQQQQQTGSGLTRYRSAPSSYFANLLNSDDGGGFGGDEFEHLFNLRASSPETQRIFSRFMSYSETSTQENITVQSQTQSQLNLPPRNNEQLQRKQSNDYSSDSQFMYSNRGPHMKIEGDGGGGGSSLLRHSSSPAGLFAKINIEKEFGAMGDFGAGKSSKTESSFSSRHMPTISEIGTKGTGENSPGVAQFSEDFPPVNSWDDILKCNNPSSHDHQINKGGDRPTTMLSHHLSLPKSSNSEFSSMEDLLKDSVPWKIRAKRGFATHPRSIAERVRRTKISERMRKLQELVPNMEKQTNTADMLDLAVDYIKDLQAHVKKLSDNRAKCSCLAKGKS